MGTSTLAKSTEYDRLIGRTKQQKERETVIRDLERDHWTSVFSKLGDGRFNRKASKEERQAYRNAAAMIQQNRTS